MKKRRKKRGSFKIYKAGYHNGSYLLLLGNNFCHFEVGDSLFKP